MKKSKSISLFLRGQTPRTDDANSNNTSQGRFFISRSSTPQRKPSEFYNFSNLVSVKDELQKQFNMIVKTPNSNRSVTPIRNSEQNIGPKSRTSSRPSSARGVFLTPQIMRNNSPKTLRYQDSQDTSQKNQQQKVDKSFSTRTSTSQIRKIKQDIVVLNYLREKNQVVWKQGSSENERKLKDQQEQIQQHKPGNLMPNLLLKDREFSKEKRYKIDELTEKRHKNEQSELDIIQKKYLVQKSLANEKELRQDKAMIDSMMNSQKNQFIGDINLHNMYSARTLDENKNESEIPKKQLKVSTNYILSMKYPHHSKMQTIDSAHSFMPSSSLLVVSNQSYSQIGSHQLIPQNHKNGNSLATNINNATLKESTLFKNKKQVASRGGNEVVLLSELAEISRSPQDETEEKIPNLGEQQGKALQMTNESAKYSKMIGFCKERKKQIQSFSPKRSLKHFISPVETFGELERRADALFEEASDLIISPDIYQPIQKQINQYVNEVNSNQSTEIESRFFLDVKQNHLKSVLGALQVDPNLVKANDQVIIRECMISQLYSQIDFPHKYSLQQNKYSFLNSQRILDYIGHQYLICFHSISLSFHYYTLYYFYFFSFQMVWFIKSL